MWIKGSVFCWKTAFVTVYFQLHVQVCHMCKSKTISLTWSRGWRRVMVIFKDQQENQENEKEKKKVRLEFMPNRTYSSFFKDSVSTHHVISYAASWAAAILVWRWIFVSKVFKAAFVVVLTKVVKTFNSVAEKSPTNLLELRHWKMFFP